MSITQNISEITPLSAFTSPNRPAEVDNLVENELPNLTQELGLLIPEINETTYQANIAAQNAENSKNTATTQAGIATTKASEANTSANQALTYKNQVMGYVVPSGASYSVEQINTQNVVMIKAQFNALSEERKANRAGSGFDNFGKGSSTSTVNVNEGIWTDSAQVNKFYLGKTTANSGSSKTNHAETIVNGIMQELKNVNSSTALAEILCPAAPTIYPYDTVLTTEQINSGVIKHADASNSGLIANGKFDTDTSGWTQTRFTPTWQVDGSVYLDATEYTAGLFSQSIALITGKQYIVEVNVVSRNTTYTQSIVNCSTSDATTSVYGSSSNLVVGRNVFTFTADGTKPYIAIKSGSHPADYITIDNIAVYPADAISRSDLVFLESWHEDISEKNFVYPLGNTQYLGGNTDGLAGITNGNFTGFETYSLFGNWQTPSALIGKGYVWSNLTEAQKRAFIANPENNCYLDGDKTIQVRYRVRVVQGVGDKWGNVDSTNPSSDASIGALTFGNSLYPNAKGKKVVISSDVFASGVTGNGFYNKGNNTWGANTDLGSFVTDLTVLLSYDGKCFALPIALVHRRNQGMYHPVYNANGTKKASDGNFWYNTAVSFTSISDCFDASKLLVASGYIGSVSGRPDGLFYDQVHESDITDLRNSSKKVEDYNRLISREFNKLVAGAIRGKEGECGTLRKVPLSLGNVNFNNGFRDFYGYLGTVADGTKMKIIEPRFWCYNLTTGEDLTNIAWKYGLSIYFYNGNANINDTIIMYNFSSFQSTRTKSNTLLHCDIIGNPTNYPTAWKQSGVFGTPLIVAEDGTSLLPDGSRDTFKLSRPLKTGTSILLALRSTDSGATWTSFTPTFNTTANEITLTNEPANNLVMVYYQTKTIMAVPVVKSEVIEYGDVLSLNTFSSGSGSYLLNTLLSKVSTVSSGGVVTTFSKFKNISLDNNRIQDNNLYYNPPIHEPANLLANISPAVKVFPYLTRTNGKAFLNLVFKEMKHNGTSWGDDNKFNIVDNVSTTTDNNAQTVLIGQKTVELPYFIAGDE